MVKFIRARAMGIGGVFFRKTYLLYSFKCHLLNVRTWTRICEVLFNVSKLCLRELTLPVFIQINFLNRGFANGYNLTVYILVV